MPLQLVKLIDPIQVTVNGTLTPQGAYDNGTDYSVGDMVDYQGSSYVMYSDAGAGTLPTNTTYWGLIAAKGDIGATGATGATGSTGATGAQGDPGEGVPTGGTTGQVLAKASGTDYDTEWVDQTGGGGAVDSVNGQTGTVVLDIDDIAPTQTGNSGKVLKTDGTNATWQDETGGGGSMDDFTVAGDAGTPQTISDANTLTIAGGTGIDTSASATDTLTVDLDSASQASLALADTALQSGDNVSELTNDAGFTTNTGTVTSVGVSGSDGIEVDSGSPVTTSGTIALGINASTLRTHINVEDGADVTDATNVDAAGATMNTDTTLAGNSYFLDEDTMSSDDATKVPSQQSVKAYADTKVDQDTYDVSHEHAVGFYGSRIGMNKWRMSTRDVKHIICWGDSVTQGVGVDSKTRSMTDGLRQVLTNEMNEEVHEGFQPMFWSQGATAARYTTSGGWATITGPSASNLSPLGLNGTQIRSTNSTLRTITWTRPSHVKCTKFYIHWVDDSTTTSGAYWSYSVDGGSTWTEVATTSPGTPTHNVEEVILDEADYDPSTIMLRNANAAGTTYTNSPSFMGLDIRHSDYGWVVHNMGGAGASLSLATALNSCGSVGADRAGDWSTVFDYYEPELVIIEFSNDTTGYVEATFETAIETACSTLSAYADLVAYGFPMQDRLSGGGNLDAVRTHTRNKVLEYNGVAVDMKARWTDMATAKANGFMPNVTFSIHPTEDGDKDIASAIGRLLRSYA